MNLLMSQSVRHSYPANRQDWPSRESRPILAIPHAASANSRKARTKSATPRKPRTVLAMQTSWPPAPLVADTTKAPHAGQRVPEYRLLAKVLEWVRDAASPIRFGRHTTCARSRCATTIDPIFAKAANSESLSQTLLPRKSDRKLQQGPSPPQNQPASCCLRS